MPGSKKEYGLAAAAIAVLYFISISNGRAQSLGDEWESLTAEKARVVFYAQGLDHSRARYLRTETRTYVLEIAQWSNTAAKHLKAIIGYIELWPGYHFQTASDPKTLVESFEFFEMENLQFSSKHSQGNKLGLAEWRRFQFDDVQCIVFAEYFGTSAHEFTSVGTQQILGYYCADPGQPLSEETSKSIVKGIGIKGIAVPEKPAELLDNASLSDAKAKPRRQVPISIKMDGSDDNLTGRLYVGNEANQGELEIQLPLPYGFCKGSWERLAGKYGTINPPNGKWRATCSNGATLSGGFESKKPGTGSGRGHHSDGREITFTYGE